MSSFSELAAFHDSMAEYFDLVSANMGTPSNPLPSFEDYIDSMTYDVLLTEAQAGASRSASFSTGALVDTTHLIAAVQREFDIRVKGKTEYFADAEDDGERTVQYLDFMQGKYMNYLRGTAPEQSKE